MISDEILKFYPNFESLSIYEESFLKYFPYLLIASVTLLIRFELKKNEEETVELKNKMSLLENKIQRIFKLSTKVRKDKKEIEKRLISDEKESLKIRDIIYEISSFNTNQIEKNILEYFSKVIPSAKMSFFINDNNIIKYSYSNYETSQKEISEYLIKEVKQSDKSILTITNSKYLDDYSIIIPIKMNNKKIYGLITVDKINFEELNRVTINNLSYFKELLSLQIKNSIIYKKQKENSFSYNEKNIYNFNFLRKLLDLEISIAKRHNIRSLVLVLNSPSFTNIEENEDTIFENIEKMYKSLFRKNDLIFYNHKNNNFVILLTLTAEDKYIYIKNKIEKYQIDYDFTYNHIIINENSNRNEILEMLEKI